MPWVEVFIYLSIYLYLYQSFHPTILPFFPSFHPSIDLSINLSILIYLSTIYISISTITYKDAYFRPANLKYRCRYSQSEVSLKGAPTSLFEPNYIFTRLILTLDAPSLITTSLDASSEWCWILVYSALASNCFCFFSINGSIFGKLFFFFSSIVYFFLSSYIWYFHVLWPILLICVFFVCMFVFIRQQIGLGISRKKIVAANQIFDTYYTCYNPYRIVTHSGTQTDRQLIREGEHHENLQRESNTIYTLIFLCILPLRVIGRKIGYVR